jgi:hypothetical protein
MGRCCPGGKVRTNETGTCILPIWDFGAEFFNAVKHGEFEKFQAVLELSHSGTLGILAVGHGVMHHVR